MNWKLLAILAAPMLVADAKAPAGPAMSVGFWVNGCSDTEGVEATNVGKQDDPEVALDKAALNLCQQDTRGRKLGDPVTYTIIYRKTQDTKGYGKVVQWGIRCGNEPAAARQSRPAVDMC